MEEVMLFVEVCYLKSLKAFRPVSLPLAPYWIGPHCVLHFCTSLYQRRLLHALRICCPCCFLAMLVLVSKICDWNENSSNRRQFEELCIEKVPRTKEC